MTTTVDTTAPTTAPTTRGRRRLHGLTGTVLRLHRPALLVWCAYVGVTVGWMLWVHYVSGAQARAAQDTCRGQDGGCVDFDLFAFDEGMSVVGPLVAYASYAVAAWAGASLTGRELEHGTARLAWTQSATPTRWLTVKLAVPAVALTVGTTVLMLVYRWIWSANQEVRSDEWYSSDPFANRGPAVVAYALCALAVGALAGLALKRALPALGTAVAFIVCLHQYLDERSDTLWPAKTLTGTTASRLPMSADQLELGAVTGSGARINDLTCFDIDTDAAYARCMADNGFTDLYAEVHPQSHFWPLHLMTTGVVLTITALLVLASFHLLRRRTGGTS
ncbi:ABC transporter permease [Streptomyces sp. NPDC101112]|uniref:ABC transporter permease n=1 Tax=Streptomyces sp. NPDC101112 TaxID=3366105 RepID=UPI0038075EDD